MENGWTWPIYRRLAIEHGDFQQLTVKLPAGKTFCWAQHAPSVPCSPGFFANLARKSPSSVADISDHLTTPFEAAKKPSGSWKPQASITWEVPHSWVNRLVVKCDEAMILGLSIFDGELNSHNFVGGSGWKRAFFWTQFPSARRVCVQFSPRTSVFLVGWSGVGWGGRGWHLLSRDASLRWCYVTLIGVVRRGGDVPRYVEGFGVVRLILTCFLDGEACF